MRIKLIWIKSCWEQFLIKTTETLLKFHKNFIKISVFIKSEWDFKQNLNWNHDINNEKLYKN